MEKKEFEQILKRALELQSLQKKSPEDSSFTNEDLQSAANRLGINQEILEKAISETGKKFKKFHLSGSPDEVREAFLKHFLMQETNSSHQHQPVRIDHNTIKIGSNSAIRIFHPLSKEIEAFVEFSSAPEGGTNITWNGNTKLGTREKIVIGGWPFLIYAFLIFMSISKGIALLPLLPIFLVFLFTSQVMLWGMQKTADRLEETLSAYFQNCQTLDEIEAHKSVKKELEEFKEYKKKKIESKQTEILKAPLTELSDEDPDENNEADQNSRKVRE